MKIVTTPLVRRYVSFSLIIILLFQTIGCNYFKASLVKKSDYITLDDIGKVHKHFIVHTSDNDYTLENIAVTTTTLSGNIIPLKTPVHYYEGRGQRYKNSEKDIRNEVHIYLVPGAGGLTYGAEEIPIEIIEEVRIIEQNTGKTIATYALGAIGIFVLILIIAAATKSSCPYIYVHDGESYIFEGEIYGGAIAHNLARDDYMPLRSIANTNGEYRLRVTNELKERQYTDLANLIVVDHPNDQAVLLDNQGQPHLVGNAEPLEMAYSLGGQNLCSALDQTDKNVYFFDDGKSSEIGVILNFVKPEDARSGKLILNAKNTLWFDYIFGEFLSLFGGSFDNWMKKKAKRPRSERMENITDNRFPMSVYIKVNGEWQFVDYIMTVGPLAKRDFVIPLDFSNIPGDDIEIKLESGFMFWELDYAAMDFTNEQSLNTQILEPISAVGTGSHDWSLALTSKDENYMTQETIGEVTELLFKAPKPVKDLSQSVFLHTYGYYELVRDFTGWPNYDELNKFREPGYFSEYSRKRFMETLALDVSPEESISDD